MISHKVRKGICFTTDGTIQMWLIWSVSIAIIASAFWSLILLISSPNIAFAPPDQHQPSHVGGHLMKINENLSIDFRDHDERHVVLKASLGLSLARQEISCKYHEKEFFNVSCSWEDEGNKVRISVLPNVPRLKCTNFVWVAVSYQDVLKDCFRLRDAHWYGGGIQFQQSWPIQKISRKDFPFITGDLFQIPDGYNGGVGERFWLSSKGVALIVSPNVPLHVSLNKSNDGRICFVGKNGFPYRNTRRAPPTLDYTVCVGKDMLTVYKDVYKMFFRYPSAIPDEKIFMAPIWTTGFNGSVNVNQSTIEQLAFDIDRHEFPSGIISIDDKWEYCYGDLVFDREKFPFPEQMFEKLEMQGFKISLWIHPFSNERCITFREGAREGYWVKTGSSDAVGKVTWWGGKGGLVDVTNLKAVKWWVERVSRLQMDYGIYSFKFEAGETTWLPTDSKLSVIDDVYPNAFTTKYVETVYTKFGRSSQVRVACRSQHLPLFIRLTAKSSVWGRNNGLKSIIPTVLHYGLMGYPFIIADTIGGSVNNSLLPSRELYIRWMQLSVFLPAIQFSIVPWSRHYDERVIHICKKALKIRNRFSPLMIRLAQEATKTGAPIIRPLWWIAPNDVITHDIDSQFLIGDSVLVAPILNQGAVARDIYLPRGYWFDELRESVYQGPRWLRKYKVTLSEVSFFVRTPKPTPA